MSAWQPMQSAPTEYGYRCLLWARILGSKNTAYSVYYAEYDGSAGSVSGERMTGWRTVEGAADYYEDTGAYIEREYLYPSHWMPLPDGPA